MRKIFKRLLVGPPISSHDELGHRLPKRIALAVFSSDALSSSAYATDEILLVLVLGGASAIRYSVPVALAVVLVLCVVVFSYRQTVKAYPKGGGAYRVAHENLGEASGLIAASALLIDYVLTVSVSIAAGVAAAGAALPELRAHRVAVALAAVILITALNLRGMKESGTIFAIPTYGFLFAMGDHDPRGNFQGDQRHSDRPTRSTTSRPRPGCDSLPDPAGLRLRIHCPDRHRGHLRRRPRVQAAQSPRTPQPTLLILGFLLSALFFWDHLPLQGGRRRPELIEQGETTTSQIAGSVFGRRKLMFYVVQAFTALILFLAANTAYADFPRLASILAKDRYYPGGWECGATGWPSPTAS